MVRQLDSVSVSIAAALVSVGLLIAAVPATQVETAAAPLVVDVDCPYSRLVIISEPAV